MLVPSLQNNIQRINYYSFQSNCSPLILLKKKKAQESLQKRLKARHENIYQKVYFLDYVYDSLYCVPISSSHLELSVLSMVTILHTTALRVSSSPVES